MGASEIEKIFIQLEEQGAGNAYVAIKRLDDVMGSLSKQRGPIGIVSAFEMLSELSDRASNSLVEVPGLAEKAAAAWSHLVGQVRLYNDAQARKAMRNSEFEIARRDAQQLADQMRAANRVPTELQAASAPKAIDFAAALAAQSQKAGSAIEAAAHGAMEEAIAIGESAKSASKLASVYDIIEKRAKATAKAEHDRFADQMRAANRVPTHLQAGANPKSLSGAAKAFQTFSRTFGPRATEGLVSTVETLETIGPIAAKVAHPVGIAAAAIGALAVATAGTAIWAGKEFGGAVIAAQGFRENMTFALTKIAGTESKANSIIETTLTTADYLGQKHADTVKQVTALMNKGLGASTADKFTRGLADMETRSPGTNFDSMVLAIGQIKSKGKLQGEELMQLAEAGLNRGEFMGNLAKQAKKNVGEIEKVMQAGKVSYKQFEDAFFATVNKNGGPLGAIANERSRQNIDAIINRVKAIPENLLFGAKAGPGMEATKNTLNSLLDWFDVSKGKGKEVRQVAGDIFNAMVEGLTGNKIDTSKGITGTLDAVLNAAREAVPWVYAIGATARDVFSVGRAIYNTIDSIGSFADSLGGIGNIAQTLSFPFRLLMTTMLGPLALLPELMSMYDAYQKGGIAGVAEAMTAPFASTALKIETWASSIPQTLYDTAASVLTSAYQLGSNLWQGVVNGIASGVAMVTSAATNLANAAKNAVKVAWDEHSPSREFFALSWLAGKGTANGFDASRAMVERSAAGMADAALGASWASSPMNMNAGGNMLAMGGGGGAVIINFTANIAIPGTSSPAQAQALGAAAMRGTREQFEAQLGSGLRRLRYG